MSRFKPDRHIFLSGNTLCFKINFEHYLRHIEFETKPSYGNRILKVFSFFSFDIKTEYKSEDTASHINIVLMMV